MPKTPENNNLPISIKEARKLLGKDGEALTDDQVRDIVVTLQGIARRHLKS